MLLEKPNDNGGSQSLPQNVFKLEEEMICVMKAEIWEGEKELNGSNNWVGEDVVNMGLTLGELGLGNGEVAQED